MKQITERQKEVLTFISEFTEENSYPPTVREIGDHFEISLRAVQDHIAALQKKGYPLYFDSPTNQVFFILEKSKVESLLERVEYSNFEQYDDTHVVARYCTSWATTREDVDALLEVSANFR